MYQSGALVMLRDAQEDNGSKWHRVEICGRPWERTSSSSGPRETEEEGKTASSNDALLDDHLFRLLPCFLSCRSGILYGIYKILCKYLLFLHPVLFHLVYDSTVSLQSTFDTLKNCLQWILKALKIN